ncbi:MAG: GatB/YqeY domain-containing protein [Nocardioidaceae bacterium]
MATLKQWLRSELTASMKARDELRSSTLRMVLTAITNAEVAGKQARVLSDDDVVGVLATESKKRREAAAAFGQAGRAELAAKEQAEAAIIAEFLPAQMSDEEIQVLVADTIADLDMGADGMRGIGKVMGALTPKTKGRADGGAVSAEVRRQLGA